jgi:hypothetical protein
MPQGGAHGLAPPTTVDGGIGFVMPGVSVNYSKPIKAATAHRARRRQDRTDRCVQLLEAAMVSRTWLVTQNRYYRDRDASRQPPEEVLQQSQEHLGKSREAIRKTTMLLRMSGPETLSGAAQAVRDAERALRELRHSPNTDVRQEKRPTDAALV